MLCPGCGKEVADTDALCDSCGSSLSQDKPHSAESLPSAGITAPPRAPDKPLRKNGKAIASLILGLLPFVLMVPVFKLVAAFHGASRIIFLSYLCLVPVAAMLAVISGRRVKVVNPQGKWTSAGEVMAILGRILGYLGLVYGVLFISAFIFVPRFVSSSRRTANQASAVGSLRTINTAATTYTSTYNRGYPPTLAALGPPIVESPNASVEPSEKAAGLIDEYMAAGRKSNYRFTYIAGLVDSTEKIQTYTVHADPVESFEAGNIYYFTDQTRVIRVERGKEANQSSPPFVK